MTFDFHCPQGHPLSAEISQQGRRIHCPQCGAQFAIPFLHQHGPHETAAAPNAADSWNPGPSAGQAANPFVPAAPPGWPLSPPPPPSATEHIPSPFDFASPLPPPVTEQRVPAFPFLQPNANAEPSYYGVNQLSRDVTAPPEAIIEPDPESAIPLVHEIPCPKGHILEAPHELLEQYVLCPVCNTRFRLKYKNSLATRRKYEQEMEARDAQSGAFWLKAAIGLAVIVVAGLIFMIALANSK